MTRPLQFLAIAIMAILFCAAVPVAALADDMVLFKNGRTLRADELELKEGMYRITTMAGGIMEVPIQLVEKVISCVVDKDVEEQRGTVPAGTTKTAGNKGKSSNVTRIPPAGMGGGGDKGGSKGNATVIPPRGGRSLGRTGAAGKSKQPDKGEK